MAGHQRNRSSLIWWPVIVTYLIVLLYQKYILLLSQKCRDSAVSNKDLYPTFVRTIPSTFKVSKSVISLLRHFSWIRFTAIVGNR